LLADGDGLTDAQEYQAGTNPMDPNSNLRITQAALGDGGEAVITWLL
jgi:Bacterial TSP3 repeat